MRISDLGSDNVARLPASGKARPSKGSSSPAMVSHNAPGFTLLELLVVISIIAIASAGVIFSMRDSAETSLEREGERLAALLETGRALSRSSGQAVHWRDTPQGFSFEGRNATSLPHNWLNADTTVQWEPGISSHRLTLGPEPLLNPQAVTLMREGRSLRVVTDGLHPFAVQTGH